MCRLTSCTLSILKSIYSLGQRPRFCHKCESWRLWGPNFIVLLMSFVGVCESHYMRVASYCASRILYESHVTPGRRTICKSHFILRVAFCASRIWLLRVALYFCESHFSFLSCILFSASRTWLLRVAYDFCESHLTSASRIWLLRVALDFCESHMTSASRNMCESHFKCASHILFCKSHFMRVAFQMCESHSIMLSPSPPKSPLWNKSLGLAAKIDLI